MAASDAVFAAPPNRLLAPSHAFEDASVVASATDFRPDVTPEAAYETDCPALFPIFFVPSQAFEATFLVPYQRLDAALLVTSPTDLIPSLTSPAAVDS